MLVQIGQKNQIMPSKFSFYRVCHQFRLTKQGDYFCVDFDYFRSVLCFFRQLVQ